MIVKHRSDIALAVQELNAKHKVDMLDKMKVLSMLPAAVYEIEKGVRNYKVTKLYVLLKLLQARLQVITKTKTITINSNECIGDWVKSIRNEIGLTQKELSNLSGKSIQTIAAIEKCDKQCTIDVLFAICNACKARIVIEPERP